MAQPRLLMQNHNRFFFYVSSVNFISCSFDVAADANIDILFIELCSSFIKSISFKIQCYFKNVYNFHGRAFFYFVNAVTEVDRFLCLGVFRHLC